MKSHTSPAVDVGTNRIIGICFIVAASVHALSDLFSLHRLATVFDSSPASLTVCLMLCDFMMQLRFTRITLCTHFTKRKRTSVYTWHQFQDTVNDSSRQSVAYVWNHVLNTQNTVRVYMTFSITKTTFRPTYFNKPKQNKTGYCSTWIVTLRALL